MASAAMAGPSGSAGETNAADTLTMVLRTNDVGETTVYRKFLVAEKNLRDVQQLAAMLPVGSEPREALQQTLEQSEAASGAATAELDRLFASRQCVHGEAARARAAEIRSKWVDLLTSDEKTQGMTYHAWVGRWSRIILSEDPPQ
jgi:hypothetical protein